MKQRTRDTDLVREVLGGETEAFGMLAERYHRPILNLMYRGTGSRSLAHDLAQDTFLRAFERLDTFRLSSRFFPWLYAIGVNRLRDHYRASGRSPESAAVEWETLQTADPRAENAERLLDARALMDGLLRLPPLYREALILRYKEECSMEEIAQALGLSVSAAKMRVHRGLDMLRELFGEERHAQ